MTIRKVCCVAALGILTVAALADDKPTVKPAGRSIAITHLYADAKGISHFRDEPLALAPQVGPNAPAGARPSPDEPLAAHELQTSPNATLLGLKLGAFEDWHRAPRHMYLVALKGMSEVTAGDGEVRRFGPGSILLMEDTTGQGHKTRAVGTEDHVALTITAPVK
ncbi:MAG TPA: hypothetical protein VLX08_09150 [Steroidobacteraceae bacterium]|nr:hypothetical protein [Steroidobacteraceae bacterium]HUK02210.1 hypothetical protein [Steroidobacteraceae bacterium]